MNSETQAAKVPLSFWIITGLGLLWNGFGAYLYMLSKLDAEAALAGATPAMRDYVATMPMWAHIGWSLGVWGSLAGSLLMLARSRHAESAFFVSLLGALASFAAQAMAGVLPVGLSAGIAAVIAFLWWYCRNETAKGTLR
jgi:hypothetical protein